MTCDCGKPIKAKGLCATHYLADYRSRKAAGKIERKPDPITLAVWSSEPHDTCFCLFPIRAKSLCSAHYFQLRRLTH